MSECYPCHYSSTALMCMMGSVQAVGFALCVETQWSRWKLGWNIRLLSVAYTVYLFYFISFKFFYFFFLTKELCFLIFDSNDVHLNTFFLLLTIKEYIYKTKHFLFFTKLSHINLYLTWISCQVM